MKVLVVGSGGREDALVWKIRQSPRVKKLFAAPGNGGIGRRAELVNIEASDIAGLVNFAKKEKIDLTVVGPEAPLVAGIVDEFEKNKLKIFGPHKESAKIEGSKVYAKELMAELNIPTAKFKIFDNPNDAKRHIKKTASPVVIKADGLASGKGVIICSREEEANAAIDKIMVEKSFGAAGEKIIIEECLKGDEASIIVLSDGKDFTALASSQDHKRIFDNDRGPNTGGMGAYSPAPVAEGETFQEVIARIIRPLIKGLAKKAMPYRGALYAGVMITDKGPFVLEFNARFGDPETQAVMPRLKSDLLELIERSISGNLGGVEAEWDERACVCVVVAAGGYPEKYEKGKPIYGLEEASSLEDVAVFHAGTKFKNNTFFTDGGRVLGVTALGGGIEDAISRAYDALQKIRFDGMHYRKDIARRALCRKEVL